MLLEQYYNWDNYITCDFGTHKLLHKHLLNKLEALARSSLKNPRDLFEKLLLFKRAGAILLIFFIRGEGCGGKMFLLYSRLIALDFSCLIKKSRIFGNFGKGRRNKVLMQLVA